MKKNSFKYYFICLVIFINMFVLIGCDIISEELVEDIFNESDEIDTEFIEDLNIHFIDVGQADCTLIELPNGETALIDGGNRGDSDLIVNYINELGIDFIDYVIATHPHEDHIGGLPKVIKNFEIGKIYMPKKSATSKIYKTLLNEIKTKGLKIQTAIGFIEIINTPNLKFQILAPNSTDYNETNEYSVVNKLIYNNTSFLFTGDAEKDSEDEMLEHGYDLSSDLLKVGHHGGRTSSNDNFLKKVKPKFAIISCGKDNQYGHPHKEVLDRLKELNTEIFRTDNLGTILVKSDGKEISINSLK